MPELPETLRGPRGIWLAVGLLTLVALALRVPLLGDSLFGDELGTYYSSVGHGPIRTIQIIASEQEVTPPLYFVLAWAVQHLGDPTVTLRLIPLLCGLALVPVTYLLGARTVGRGAGLLAAAFVALGPFAIFYSTEARAYSLAALLGIGSTLALLNGIDTGRRRWWVAYAALSAGVVYSHYTVAFVLLAQLAWAWFAHPECRRPLLAANVAAAAAFLPWFAQFLEDGRSQCAKIIAAGHPLDFGTFWSDLVRLWIGHPFYDLDGPLGAVPGTAALWLCGAGAILAALAALAFRGRPLRMPPSRALLVVVIAASPAVVGVYSAVVTNSIYAPRNLIGSLPALALVVAAVVLATRVVLLRLAAAALLLGASGAGAARMLQEQSRRPDYAAAADFIVEHGSPEDVVVDAEILTGPGPWSSIDVELMRDGRTGQPRLNLGAPPLGFLLQQHARLGAAPCDAQFAAPQSPETVAAQAARQGAGRRIFVLSAADTAPYAKLRANTRSGVGRLLAALPPRFAFVAQRSVHGLARSRMTVYELRDRG